MLLVVEENVERLGRGLPSAEPESLRAEGWLESFPAVCGGELGLMSVSMTRGRFAAILAEELEVDSSEVPALGSVSELSWVRTAVNSRDCLPLMGVTGSFGDSLSDSVSSRMAQARSVG